MSYSKHFLNYISPIINKTGKSRYLKRPIHVNLITGHRFVKVFLAGVHVLLATNGYKNNYQSRVEVKQYH